MYESDVYRELLLDALWVLSSQLIFHLYQTLVYLFYCGLEELKVPITFSDSHLPVELQDVYRMSLVKTGLKASDVVTFDIDPRVWLKVMHSQVVSLPLCKTVKGLKMNTWQAIVSKLDLSFSFEESILDPCAARNEDRGRHPNQVQA